jgi:hypothetical protein
MYYPQNCSVVFTWRHFPLSCHLVLHLVHIIWVLLRPTLLPFWLAWGVSSYLVLLLPTTGRCTSHHLVLSMHCLPLSHHASESTCVRQHFVVHAHWVVGWSVVCASHKIVLLSPLWKTLITVLTLSLNVNWRLRPNPVFWRCRAWFLRVSTFVLLHHLATYLSGRHIASHQIVVLLYKTEWVRRWSIVVHSILCC